MKWNVAGGAAGLVVAGLLLGGCGGGKASGAPASPGAKSAVAVSGKKTPTGRQLKAMLLPAAAMPKGLKPNAGGTRNSGTVVAPPSKAPVPARKLCGMLGETAWIRVAGIESATFAQSDYTDAAQTNEVAEEIDAFHPGEGRQVMAAIRRTFARCRTYVDKSEQVTAHIRTVSANLPASRGDGVRALLTTPVFDGGSTLVAIREGDVVVTTLCNSTGKDKGARAVAYAEAIAKKVRAAG